MKTYVLEKEAILKGNCHFNQITKRTFTNKNFAIKEVQKMIEQVPYGDDQEKYDVVHIYLKEKNPEQGGKKIVNYNIIF